MIEGGGKCQAGRYKGREKRRFIDEEKEFMKFVCVREEDADQSHCRWRLMGGRGKVTALRQRFFSNPSKMLRIRAVAGKLMHTCILLCCVLSCSFPPSM